MNETNGRCKDCRHFYYRDSECRRYAPRLENALVIHNSELLRDVAWSIRVLAKIDPPDKDDTLDDLNREAYDFHDHWPLVNATDWCGEFAEQT